MTLPELSLQVLYGRIAWAVVAAATLVGVWAWWRTPSRAVLASALLISCTAMALPGNASPAYWLVLAFQWPSALCAALSACTLVARWSGQHQFTAMPVALAACTAMAGTLLYLDASGWLAWGWYFAGFNPNGAPVVALLLATACATAVARKVWPWQAGAILMALTLYMTARLPTGNLWDALLDPLVWLWSTASLIAHWRTRRRHDRATSAAG